MKRHEIISKIGEQYLSSNIENEEFSYPKAFGKANIDFSKIKISDKNGKTYEKLDLRFTDNDRGVSVLIETKANFDKANNPEEQLSAYMSYEKVLTQYEIIGILANTEDNRIKVWKDYISNETMISDLYNLQTFENFADIIKPTKKNNKEQVMRNTYQLNEKLHTYGITEKLRSQFVGTCILALKENLSYRLLSTSQIISGIKDILTQMLSKNLNKAQKLSILDTKVLNDQDVRNLSPKEMVDILDFIKNNILVYINDKTTMGQDLLNLFFTTFNKYVGKTDKNQAFTPDHIVHFMCKVIGISRCS